MNSDIFENYYRSAKIQKVFEIIENLGPDEKVIIFSHFLLMLKCLSFDMNKTGIKHFVGLSASERVFERPKAKGGYKQVQDRA
jgi:hypothetical protein